MPVNLLKNVPVDDLCCLFHYAVFSKYDIAIERMYDGFRMDYASWTESDGPANIAV